LASAEGRKLFQAEGRTKIGHLRVQNHVFDTYVKVSCGWSTLDSHGLSPWAVEF